MVTEFFLSAFSRLAAFMVGLLPGWSLPSWLTGLPGTGDTIGGYVSSMALWLSLGAVGVAFAFVLAAVTVALTVRVTRMAISHVTGGGGSVS
jgi:hypothetical protein